MLAHPDMLNLGPVAGLKESKMASLLRKHFIIVVVVITLTLIVTFPTIVYVFRTDVIWLPSNDRDTYLHLWDAWFGRQVLAGKADRIHTDLLFYPQGISLVRHPLGLPNVITTAALNLILPLSNAYSLAYLLIIISCALSAYVYLLWLFKDKWIALFGAVVFGFSQHVVSEPHHPNITFLATIPLALYFLHRGLQENRSALVILAGLLTGFTSLIIMYTYVILLTMLGFYFVAFAIKRWRDSRFWRLMLLFVAVTAVSSFWTVFPLISDREATEALLAYYRGPEFKRDAISIFFNHAHPILGPLADSILQSPESVKTGNTSFLGYLPLALICFGLIWTNTRRAMVPWGILCGAFLILRLGSTLEINGVAYPEILLPKHYLDQLAGGVYKAYWVTDQFMAGALLPFAILTCFGLLALQKRFPATAKPVLILALVIIVAFEYYKPIDEQIVPPERVAFIQWLKSEENQEDIRIINLPIGGGKARLYGWYQTFNGYPHVDGAISRLSDDAFNYIQANPLLNGWHNARPMNCEAVKRDVYLAGLAQLEEDGFSHIAHHVRMNSSQALRLSFKNVDPDNRDEYVEIYRLDALREGCREDSSAGRTFTLTYVDALKEISALADEYGEIIVFPPDVFTSSNFLYLLRHLEKVEKDVVSVLIDEHSNILFQSADTPDLRSAFNPEIRNALWLLNDTREFSAEKTEAYQEWFLDRYKPCKRFHEEQYTAIDLYLKSDIPCAAIDDSSALNVIYDGGLRLRNLSYELHRDEFRLYLAWTNETDSKYAFSLQFFDEDGQKALQYDRVIFREILAAHVIDTAPLPEGVYSLQLIVYDYNTQKSQGGVLASTGKRFERELEIAEIVWER